MANSDWEDEVEQKGTTQERLFFGENAMIKFWSLFKSNRCFKDYDPRK